MTAASRLPGKPTTPTEAPAGDPSGAGSTEGRESSAGHEGHEGQEGQEGARNGGEARSGHGGERTAGASAAHSLERMIKPRLRGWLHAGMFPAVLAAGIFLTALAVSPRGRIACGVFTLTACLLFGTSALYHRGDWSPRLNAVLRRLDHANIFLIIAGTYTPLTVLLLPPGSETLLLYGIWAAAGLGIAFRVFWVGAPRWLYTPCYIAMGWAAVFYMPEFLHRGGVAVLVCVIAGGVLYSAGGLIYGIKRPNPSPHWFGFHEVFHSFTLAGFVAHYVGISLVAYQHP
jgi:hemolysin III